MGKVSKNRGYQERSMRCARCAGLRTPEIMSEGGTRLLALRCILCGDITDRLILQHRTYQMNPLTRQPRTPIYRSTR